MRYTPTRSGWAGSSRSRRIGQQGRQARGAGRIRSQQFDYGGQYAGFSRKCQRQPLVPLIRWPFKRILERFEGATLKRGVQGFPCVSDRAVTRPVPPASAA